MANEKTKKDYLIPISDKRLKELINETGLEAERLFIGKQDETWRVRDINFALKELEIHRLQHKKRDLMIRKAQLLKQNKSLLEQQKEGKKDG